MLNLFCHFWNLITRQLLFLRLLPPILCIIFINRNNYTLLHPEITIYIPIGLSRLCEFSEGESEGEGEGSRVKFYSTVAECSDRV